MKNLPKFKLGWQIVLSSYQFKVEGLIQSSVRQFRLQVTGAFSFVGHKGDADNDKYVELQKEPVTAKQYQELYEKWQKEKAESNKKAQEDLANHVQ